jgi:NAD(P)-dependent dehydrogenase (short-subunit alcohol dehydrogenase family)
MEIRFDGKTVLVTGAARGIGARIAASFAEHGAIVYGADVGEGATLKLDVTDRHALREAVERIRSERGGIDVLVNNAGVLAAGPFDSTSGEHFDRLVGVNFTGIFNCVQAVVPAMRGRKGASVINIASVSHDKGGGLFGNVWYGATKAGVVAMTKGLARELGPEAIRVNAISPVVVGTDMVHALMTPQARERILGRIPLGRIAEADDVARLALFLASDAADFITGENVAVDGGFLRT